MTPNASTYNCESLDAVRKVSRFMTTAPAPPGWIVEAKRKGARDTWQNIRWYVAISDPKEAMAAIQHHSRATPGMTFSIVRSLSKMELDLLMLKRGDIWEAPG